MPRAWLIVFQHESDFGNSPAHNLFDRISAKHQDGDGPDNTPSRSFDDYQIFVDQDGLPDGITVLEPF